MNKRGTMAVANTALIFNDRDEQYDVEDTNLHTVKDITTGVMVGLVEVDDNDEDDILTLRTQQQSEVDYSKYRYYYWTSPSMREEGEVICHPCFVNAMANNTRREWQWNSTRDMHNDH